MSRDDYDRILDLGWPEFAHTFMKNRIFDDVPPERLPPECSFPDTRTAWAKIGLPVLSGGDVAPPIELLCGARSLEPFCLDLCEVPEQVEAVMEAMVPHLAKPVTRKAKEQGYPAVWVGGWRGAPELFSPDMWKRFVWPYLEYLVEEVIASGLVPILHLDSDWTRELACFRELPRGKCILSLDGVTDIFAAKEILRGHMCLMGDVPAKMLAFDSPEKVRAYCSRLIERLGPEGFILQSGCDIPTNAKLDNVQAMVDVARRKETQ
jgi:uroporphyrinogen-III decarboxylase